MKREAVHHSKMKRLCRKLDIPLWQAVGLLESIWHITARQTPRGDIGKLSDEDIAIALEYRGDEGKMIDALVSTGWLDRNNQHRLVVHDWPDHAEDGVHMKVARAKTFFIRQDEQGETILERPNLRRLDHREREPLRQFYDECIQSEKTIRKETSVRTDQHKRAHGVRTDVENVRTKGQSVRGPSLSPALTPPIKQNSVGSCDTSFQSSLSPAQNGNGWHAFTEAFEATGRETTPADFANCKAIWAKLELTDQLACVAGIRRDIEQMKYTGPEYWPKPKKYLFEREWERKPQRQKKETETLAERIAKL